MPTSEDKARGARIRRAREQLGLTPADVVEALDVARQTVSNWENGHTEPKGLLRHRLAELLGLDERWHPVESPAASPSVGRNIYESMSNAELADHLHLLAATLSRRLTSSPIRYEEGIEHKIAESARAKRAPTEKQRERLQKDDAGGTIETG